GHLSGLTDANTFFAMAGAYLGAGGHERAVAMVRARFRQERASHGLWNVVFALRDRRSPASDELLEEIATTAADENVRGYAQRLLESRKQLVAGAER
ncbi:MAG: hypothetical protein ACREI7_11735, partial [Myxococcota bacterium]